MVDTKQSTVMNMISLTQSKRWDHEEIQRLLNYAPTSKKGELLKIFPDRTWRALNIKICRLGISRKQFQSEFKDFAQPVPSTDFAWWLGALAGDGHVAHDRVTLNVTDKDFADHFKKVGEQIFKIKSSYKEYLRQDPKIKRKLQYIIMFYSKKLSQYLGDWSWLNWDKTLKNRFPWILDKRNFITSFLSGYFDAEGSVICGFYKRQHKFSVKYTAQPIHIKKFLNDFLGKLGIKSKIYAEGVYIYDIQNLRGFASFIKSSIKRKQKRLNSIKNIKIRYEGEYKLTQELRNQNLKSIHISMLLGIPKPTLDNWLYKGCKPNHIIKGHIIKGQLQYA